MTSLASRAEEALRRTLAWSRAREWAGYDKHDALMSPLVRAATLGLPALEFAAVQAVMRAPVNVRPILGVRTARNPKGIGLFIRALLDARDLDPSYAEEARRLADWLVENRSPGHHLPCWGYQFPWPSIHHRLPAGAPNAIVTAFAAEGLLEAHRAFGDPRHIEASRGAAEWLLSLPCLVDEPGRLCLAYTPSTRDRIVNVNAVVAGFLARLGRLDEARRLAGYVLSVQTPEGAWWYSDPPGTSTIEHDNYHTGGILDGLLDLLEAREDPEVRTAYDRGLAFYASNLFEADGFPRWERRRKFPGDIHGAAQGILTFARAGDGARAGRIVAWALANLYDPDGRWYYQVGRFGTKRWTLMRWANAWTARALARYLRMSR